VDTVSNLHFHEVTVFLVIGSSLIVLVVYKNLKSKNLIEAVTLPHTSIRGSQFRIWSKIQAVMSRNRLLVAFPSPSTRVPG
jgi:hypothetical protein